MTRIKRPAAAVGAAALLAFSLSACGGAPTDASEKDFCKAYNDSAFNADIDEDDFDAQADALNEYAEKLDEVGTPEDIPDDARKGFEVIVEAFGDVNADDLEDEDAQQAIEDKYKDDEDDVSAFFAYATTTCLEGLDLPTDLTDLPTDLPTDLTDLPTDLTDLPTDLSDLTEIPTELSDLTEIPTDLSTE